MSDNTKEGILEIGCSGDSVRLIQTMLMSLGYYAGDIDGDFGEQTARSVRQFQIVWELHCDGIVGPETQDVIFSRFSNEFRKIVRETPVNGYIPVPNSGAYRPPRSGTTQDTPFDGEVSVERSDSPVWKRWLVKNK